MSLAEALLDEFGQGIKQLTLIPSYGGVFEVMADGDLIYSKKKEGRHPTIKEIEEILRPRIGDH